MRWCVGSIGWSAQPESSRLHKPNASCVERFTVALRTSLRLKETIYSVEEIIRDVQSECSVQFADTRGTRDVDLG